MDIALVGGTVVSPLGISQRPLVVDTRRGWLVAADRLKDAHKIDLTGYFIYPALINAHDHLELNHYPRTKFQEIYQNAHQWGEGVSARLTTSPYRELQQYPLWERCWLGGLKNMLCGALTVAHHNPLHRPLRWRRFPVDVVRHYGWAHSLHFADTATIQANYHKSAPYPFMIHLAEGIDAVAAQEWATLLNLGVVGERTVLIHGVGLSAEMIAEARAYGVKLVWCPSSNSYLLGQTASVEGWGEAVALGSDSRLTADGDLLAEMGAAYATGQVSAETIFHMVTDWAEKVVGLGDITSLTAGSRANLLVLPQNGDPYTTLVQARRDAVAMVVKRGRIVLADVDIAIPQGNYQQVAVDGHSKMMAAWLAKKTQQMGLAENGLQFF